MSQDESGPTRKRHLTLVWAAAVVLLLGACQTNQGPAGEQLAAALEDGIDAASFKQDESLRVRFQPPIGNSRPVRAELAEDVNLELAVFNLDPHTGDAYGDVLAPSLATASATVAYDDGVYSSTWNVSQTAAEAAGDYVRLEVRPSGVPLQPVCNEPWGACLGYFDARIVRTGGQGAGAATAGGDVEATAADLGVSARPLRNTVTVPDHASLPVNFKLLAGTAGLPSAGVVGLVALGGGGDKLDTAGNCSANDFSRPGQGLQAVGAGLQAVGAGLQAVGAVGGLFVDSTGRVFDPSAGLPAVITNSGVADQLLHHRSADPYGPKVAVLIVDSFNGFYDLPARLLDAVDLVDGELEGLLREEHALSHGALVFHQAKQLASAVTHDPGAWPGGPNAAEAKYHVMEGEYAGSAVLIKAVDAADLATDDLAGKIRAAIEQVSAHGYLHVVVNMSFAIVPCAVTHDVASTVGTGTIPTFEEYVASLLQVNAIAPQHEVALGELTSTPLALAADPFLAYLACPLISNAHGADRCDGKTDSLPPTVKNLVHVAASGNFGNDYALYPAALPTVISVGALDATGDGYSAQRSAFSNAATVLAPGALFELATKDDQRIVYAGTSFAAPVVSVFAALDLLAGADRSCEPGDLTSTSGLAHALALDEQASDALLNSPLLSSFLGTAPSAVAELCD